MRLRLVLLSAFFLSACSSGPSPKKESAPSTGTVPAQASSTETKAESKDAKKKSAASAAGGKIECSVTGDERVLEVREAGKGCELTYVKGGNEGVVATSANGKEHCVSVQTKIKERLEGAGFKCN